MEIGSNQKVAPKSRMRIVFSNFNKLTLGLQVGVVSYFVWIYLQVRACFYSFVLIWWVAKESEYFSKATFYTKKLWLGNTLYIFEDKWITIPWGVFKYKVQLKRGWIRFIGIFSILDDDSCVLIFLELLYELWKVKCGKINHESKEKYDKY